MLTCSECGHTVVAEKELKKLKDGIAKEYRYYYCCNKNSKDVSLNQPTLEEKNC